LLDFLALLCQFFMSFIPLRERNVTASLSSIVQTLQHNPEEKKYMDWQRIASQQIMHPWVQHYRYRNRLKNCKIFNE